MSELAIRVEGLSKRYVLRSTFNMNVGDAVALKARRASSNLLRAASQIARLRMPTLNATSTNEFWALRDVSFELRYGEVLGIIGQNGAGKSTLLKILSQITLPSEGRAEIFGRIGSLLEVGTGFNPELSGRENIQLYGAILGMTKADIAARFDEIVAFAEIERFLDEPIKHYSSGMHSRLGFSVAAHLECDILLVDEVLSVGDAAFRDKCLGKMNDVTGQGRAVVFVSHNMTAVNSMCQYGMHLEGGQVKYFGSAADTTARYLEGVKKNMESASTNPTQPAPDSNLETHISWVQLANEAGKPSLDFDYTEVPVLEFKFEVRAPSRDYFAAVIIEDLNGNVLVHATDQDEDDSRLSMLAVGQYHYRVALPVRLFREGRYFLTVGIERRQDGRVHKLDRVFQFNIHDMQRTAALRSVAHRRNVIAPELGWDLRPNDLAGSLARAASGAGQRE